jgi:hypothetical protein
LLAQETSAITATESAETRIIDFFMARTVVDAGGRFKLQSAVSRKALCAYQNQPRSFPARAGFADGMFPTAQWCADQMRGLSDPKRGAGWYHSPLVEVVSLPNSHRWNIVV